MAKMCSSLAQCPMKTMKYLLVVNSTCEVSSYRKLLSTFKITLLVTQQELNTSDFTDVGLRLHFHNDIFVKLAISFVNLNNGRSWKLIKRKSRDIEMDRVRRLEESMRNSYD